MSLLLTPPRELTALPKPSSWNLGILLLKKEQRGKKENRGKEGRDRGRENRKERRGKKKKVEGKEKKENGENI